MAHGTLSSIDDAAFLRGGNLIAIGDGSPGGWELLQFRDATLVSPGTWELGHRLRGQLGTDAATSGQWPAGSWVVVMNGTPRQIELRSRHLRQERHFRIGPARKLVEDSTYVHQVHRFEGNGLRPYSPVHLRADGHGPVRQFSWIRRTRIDGDDWDLPEVPLGEETEVYEIRVLQYGETVRTVTRSSADWTYDPEWDGLTGHYAVTVAQVSARYGAGPVAKLELFA